LLRVIHSLVDYLKLDAYRELAFMVLSLLLLQAGILFALSLYVAIKRLKRLFSRYKNQEREDKIRKAIIDCYFDTSREKNAEQSYRMKLLKRENRGFVRRILISTTVRFPAESRVILTNLYIELGYLKEDLKLLRSWLWWKRLEAVTRLERVRLPQALPHLLERIEDRNELVAVAAMRALSSLNFPAEVEMILDSLSRRAPYRKDIFIDVLNNLCRDRVEEVVGYLGECFDPYIASICISVLGNLRVERAHDVFLSFLSSSDDDVVCEAVRALSKIRRSSQSVDKLRRLLKHESPKVRSCVVEALTRMQDLEAIPLIRLLETDDHVDVRRSVFYSLRRGVE